MQQEKLRLSGFGIDEGGQLGFYGGVTDVSPVMGNNLPAQVGRAPSGWRINWGMHFSEGGRELTHPVTSLPLRKAWQFENLRLDPVAI